MSSTPSRSFYSISVGARHIHVSLTDHEADAFRSIAKEYAWLQIESL